MRSAPASLFSFALALSSLGCGATPGSPFAGPSDGATAFDGPYSNLKDAAADAAGGADAARTLSNTDLAAATSDLAFTSLVTARPYTSAVPTDYDGARAWPLLILLHGYGETGAIQDAYFGFSKIVDAKGFLYAYPDGTPDSLGNRYWNATDACCAQLGTPVDDVAYLDAVIDDMSSRYHVDPKRIFVAGHSNGGFMAHRMACDASPRVAAIMALAGDDWLDVTRCNPTSPVAVLQVHGTADTVVLYTGGAIYGDVYPSAQNSIGSWVKLNGCATKSTAGTPMDIDSLLPGSETTVATWPSCAAGGAAELWSIQGGSHFPNLQSNWAGTIYDWLAAHPRP